MKKTRLLLILGVAIMARAQEPADTHPTLNAPAGTDPTTVSFPFERIQTPTPVYLAGKGYQVGQKYAVVRELRDPNRYEIFTGQHALLKTMGQPYSELARVRIIDTRNKMAIAEIEMSCDPVNPGDYVIPYVEKPTPAFHPPLRFDRFLPSNGKTTGRIVMAKDFDSEIGPGVKVYLNVGSNQGVKPGDYFRAVRTYEG